MKNYLKELESGTDCEVSSRGELFMRFKRELKAHSIAENTIFYPALKRDRHSQ